MVVYAIDEQIEVELDRTHEGFLPRSIRALIPGQTELVVPSAELKDRRFGTDVDAEIAAFDELKKNQPDLFGSWAKREGFF
jgi:hypothetical protein